MAARPRRSCTAAPSSPPGGKERTGGGKERVQCAANLISENLPVGWQAVVEGRNGKVYYTASDGSKLASHAQALRYLAEKKMDKGDQEEILSSLQWNESGDSLESFARKHGIDTELKRKKRGGLRSELAPSPQSESPRATRRAVGGVGSASSKVAVSCKEQCKQQARGAGGLKGSVRSKGAHRTSSDGKEEEESARRRGQHDSVSEPGRKRAKLQEEDEEDEGKAGGGGRAGRAAQGPKVAIPSYLRSRFGDKGSAIGDAPPTPCPKGGEGAGSGEECSEGDYHEAVEKMVDERSRRNTATRRRNKEALTADNNILLFGQWYRKKLNIEGDQPAPTKPSISDLRAFVLDRNAYWGDEIALRVFADAFKIVVCVVLQVEERLQVVFPTKGGAQALFYLVLTHRGAVPHYRSVSVGDRHVLPLHEMSNTGCDGQAYVTPGMVARLCEDCPHGWDANLSPEALSFFMGRTQPKMTTIRHSVVRNLQTLREVKSEVAIEEQCSAGTAIQSWVIDGFPAGTGFVERIACSRNETNPAFTISKTPGDGDCLFYSMMDVATEILRSPLLKRQASPEIDCLRSDQDVSKLGVTVMKLRQMVSESLTEEELSFFNAANNFV